MQTPSWSLSNKARKFPLSPHTQEISQVQVRKNQAGSSGTHRYPRKCTLESYIPRQTSTSVPPVAKSSYLVKDQDFSGIRTSPWGMRSGEPANGPSSMYLKFNTILCPYSLHMNLESGMYGKRSALWELWMWSSTWQLRCVCQGFHPDS